MSLQEWDYCSQGFHDITSPVLVGDGQKIWSLQPFSAWFSEWNLPGGTLLVPPWQQDTVSSLYAWGMLPRYDGCMPVWFLKETIHFNQECCSSSCAFKSVICSHNTPDHSIHFLFFRCIIVASLFQHRILRHRSTASRLLQRMKSEMGCEASHWKVSRLSLRWGHPSHWNHRGGTIQRKCPKWLDPKIDQDYFSTDPNHQP